MIQLGDLIVILDLHRQGLSISAIARRTGRDPKTVRKYIARGLEPPAYGPWRAGRPNKLAPYLDYLRERIAAFPDLSAVRLTRELRERGYTGAYTAVKRFAAAIRPDTGPKPFEVRFETPAGKQAQVDFARFVTMFADKTTAPVLDPGRGKAKTGQLWAYARDDRPWGGTDPPGVAYVYAPDRKAERPITHLAGFTGVLQVDGYAGYRTMAERGGVKLAFCWSHVRRRFYELAIAGPAPIASEALERVARLYAIESEIRGRSAEERRAVRHEKSQPIVQEFEPWLAAKLALISQKTKLAEAIRYALSRWQGLSLFLDDGRVEIDSNVVERAIRPIALNRKNALFAGSDGGGEHWAIIASLIETCKLGTIDPHIYLAGIITKIVNGHTNSQIDDLLPWAYAPMPTLKAVA